MFCIKCKKEIDDIAVYCQFCGKKQYVAVSGKNTKSRGNGTGSVYKLPNGKWQAEITLYFRTDENGKPKRIKKTKAGFKTKKEALEYLPHLKSNTVTPKIIKFCDLYTDWSILHYQNISKSKATAYKIAYKKCAPLHYMNACDIKLKDIQSVIDAEKGSYYPKHDIKVLCNLMFKFAMQNDYIDKNYSEFVRLPPVPKSQKEAFSAKEIQALWKDYKKGNVFTGYILIMIYTGMRLGELQKIAKDKVFLEQNYMIGGIKTESGIDREIGICNLIKPIIEHFYNKGNKKLLEMAEDNFYESYYETLKRAKVRRLTPHCCRHTTATALVLAGVEPKIIQAIMGHSSFSVTADNYVHISLGDKLSGLNKM